MSDRISSQSVKAYDVKQNFSYTPVSVMTLEGRIVIPYQGYNKHLELIKKGADIGGARIWYCKFSKIYYLLVGLEVG